MVGFRLEIVHNSRLYIAVQDAGQWTLLAAVLDVMLGCLAAVAVQPPHVTVCSGLAKNK
jgi:hypothetical protein